MQRDHILPQQCIHHCGMSSQYCRDRHRNLVTGRAPSHYWGAYIRSGAPDNRNSLRVPGPPDPSNGYPQAGTQLIARLSLFDGTGLARIAIDEAISDCGGITLARPAFVEHDVHLARQVATVWNTEVNQGRTRVPHIPIACDIWDLCRPEHT